MEVTHGAQWKANALDVEMGNPHNQDVVKVVFIKNNIIFTIEVERSTTVEVVDRFPPLSPFEDEGIEHVDISTLHDDTKSIHKEANMPREKVVHWGGKSSKGGRGGDARGSEHG